MFQPKGAELVALMRASVRYHLKHNNPQAAVGLLEDLRKYVTCNTPCYWVIHIGTGIVHCHWGNTPHYLDDTFCYLDDTSHYSDDTPCYWGDTPHY